MLKLGTYPCICGSGKQYRKCCLFKRIPTIPIKAIKHFQKAEQGKTKLHEMGIYVNYVKPILFQEKKVWALGSKVYHGRRPEETFHEFVMDIFKLTLGKEWLEQELKAEDKHFIVQCYLHYFEWQKKNATEQNKVAGEKVWGSIPDGWTQSIASLAFDVCSLIHTNNLPPHLLERLKNKNEYQGARYEIAIAAIFARLDCEINFLDDDESLTTKHCEFFALHRSSGLSIAVEAKSRHRAGVIHTEGVEDERKNMKGNVEQLLNRALKQSPQDRPFMIFIDLNSPLTSGVDFEKKQWYKDVEKMMHKKDACTPANPDPYNGIFFTNYAYHYEKNKEISSGETFSILPFFAKFPLPNSEFVNMLSSALSHYGSVPNIDIDID